MLISNKLLVEKMLKKLISYFFKKISTFVHEEIIKLSTNPSEYNHYITT